MFEFFRKYFILIIAVIVVSFFMFPIGFKGWPATLNTKQVIAVAGMVFFVFDALYDGSMFIHKETLASFLLACFFSLWCYLTVAINNTADYSYATYFISFSVWLCGAFGTVRILKVLFGEVNLALITKVVAIVCVMQCISAQMVDSNPAFQAWVDHWIVQDQIPKRLNRLYGLGISLDSGGVRLCMGLFLISYQLAQDEGERESRLAFWTYFIAFVTISVLGNMIARTTTIGMGLGLAYFFFTKMVQILPKLTKEQILQSAIFLVFFVLVILAIANLDKLSPKAYRKVHFAFEAFFNYFEKGEFRTDSSDELMRRMWTWPDDFNGWIMGYGYFENLQRGAVQTDIGYCRFVRYCGLVGMILFSIFFVYNARIVARNMVNSRRFSLYLLSFTFILWIKVSTDIYPLYALLFCVNALDEETEGDIKDLSNARIT